MSAVLTPAASPSLVVICCKQCKREPPHEPALTLPITTPYQHAKPAPADLVTPAAPVLQDKLPFVSAKKVVREMGEPIASALELISFHTVSKGSLGECGLRGGYLEATNILPGAFFFMVEEKVTRYCKFLWTWSGGFFLFLPGAPSPPLTQKSPLLHVQINLQYSYSRRRIRREPPCVTQGAGDRHEGIAPTKNPLAKFAQQELPYPRGR